MEVYADTQAFECVVMYFDDGTASMLEIQVRKGYDERRHGMLWERVEALAMCLLCG